VGVVLVVTVSLVKVVALGVVVAGRSPLVLVRPVKGLLAGFQMCPAAHIRVVVVVVPVLLGVLVVHLMEAQALTVITILFPEHLLLMLVAVVVIYKTPPTLFQLKVPVE
jgi:hypothetical protein